MGVLETKVLIMLVEVGYLQSLELACNRNLGCMNERAVFFTYVVRRNGVMSCIWAYLRDPRYVRDDRGPRGVFLFIGRVAK